MQKLLLILCLVSIFSMASATDGNKEKTKSTFSLQVLVIDAETGEPIPAAEIAINQRKYAGFTDFDGLANFDNFQEGIYDIEVSFVSYEKQHLKAQKLDVKNHQLIVKL